MRASRILIGTVIAVAIVAAAYAYLSTLGVHSEPPTHPGYCYFNGTSYMQYNKTVSGNFSVSAYVNFSGPGVLISQGIGNNSHAEWYLGIGGETNDMLSFGVFSNASTGNGTTFGWRFATTSPAYGKWREVTGVYDTNYVKLYVNGTLVSETATPYPPINGSRVIFLGRRTSAFYVNGTPSFEYFTGEVKDVEVFNVSLSQKQVSELANGTSNMTPVLAGCNVFFST